MDTRELAERVNELIDFNSYGFENESCSKQMIEDHIESIAIEIGKYLDQLFWQDDNFMLAKLKLLNRFDDAIERWEKRETKDWGMELICDWHYYNLEIEHFPIDFLIEKFSFKKVEHIYKLKRQIESYKIESHRATSETKEAKFILNPLLDKKSDLVRILNALWGLGIFVNLNEDKPTKKEFMREMGNVFGVDLSNFQSNLDGALKGSLETNLKVFKEMLEFTEKAYETKLEKKKIKN